MYVIYIMSERVMIYKREKKKKKEEKKSIKKKEKIRNMYFVFNPESKN